MELSVNVATDRHWALHWLDVYLTWQDFFCLYTIHTTQRLSAVTFIYDKNFVWCLLLKTELASLTAKAARALILCACLNSQPKQLLEFEVKSRNLLLTLSQRFLTSFSAMGLYSWSCWIWRSKVPISLIERIDVIVKIVSFLKTGWLCCLLLNLLGR